MRDQNNIRSVRIIKKLKLYYNKLEIRQIYSVGLENTAKIQFLYWLVLQNDIHVE